MKDHLDIQITDDIDDILRCSCTSRVCTPTRFSSNSQPFLLDHIYTNILISWTFSWTAVCGILDHLFTTSVNFTFDDRYAQKFRTKIRCSDHGLHLVADQRIRCRSTGAEPDIFIWGGPLEGPVLQQGELSMVCVGLSERDLKNFRGARQNFGGAVTPLAPP